MSATSKTLLPIAFLAIVAVGCSGPEDPAASPTPDGGAPGSAPANDSTRTFSIGDRVEIEASNHWVPCVVVENHPDAIMRVRCEAYPALSRGEGVYTVDRDNPAAVRHATGQTGTVVTAPAAPSTREQDPTPAGLKLGEYACYGSGGRILAGLGFIVLAGNRYTDPDGGNAGSFAITGTTVAFRGGHLDGETGRDLRGHSFTMGDQAECEPY